MVLADTCFPYSCPGDFFSLSTPTGELLARLPSQEREVGPQDARWLGQFGWGPPSYLPVATDPSWPPERAAAAVALMRTRSEIAGRRHAAQAPDAYRPYTSDPIGAPGQPNWDWAGGEWKGVRPYPVQNTTGVGPATRETITCGMLKDAGVISSPGECQAEQVEVASAYRAWQVKQIQKGLSSPGRRFVNVAMRIGLAIASMVLPGGSFVALTFQLDTARRKLDLDLLLDVLTASASSGVVTGPGATALQSVISSVKSSRAVLAHIEAKKRAKKKLRQAADEIEALNEQLADLIESRESLDVIVAKTHEINRQIAAANAQLESGAKWLLALALLGALAYRVTRG